MHARAAAFAGALTICKAGHFVGFLPHSIHISRWPEQQRNTQPTQKCTWLQTDTAHLVARNLDISTAIDLDRIADCADVDYNGVVCTAAASDYDIRHV